MYREKRKNRRFCTYEAVVRGGGMYREKRKKRRLCTYETVVRGGACKERKGKRGGYEHMKLW